MSGNQERFDISSTFDKIQTPEDQMVIKILSSVSDNKIIDWLSVTGRLGYGFHHDALPHPQPTTKPTDSTQLDVPLGDSTASTDQASPSNTSAGSSSRTPREPKTKLRLRMMTRSECIVRMKNGARGMVCTRCRQLKSLSDFPDPQPATDSRTRACHRCKRPTRKLSNRKKERQIDVGDNIEAEEEENSVEKPADRKTSLKRRRKDDDENDEDDFMKGVVSSYPEFDHSVWA